ncbi:DUF4870 family protein [Tepidimonas sp.]|uniref:DUF4870 family protein n=1 Tax=Tepidimonas sp. TaxID=2002775 RepID=UPI002FDF9DEE
MSPPDDPIDVTPKRVTVDAAPTAEALASLRQLTLVVYILYALSWLVGITALVAIIINYVKRADVAGTLYESHFTWQIRTFWWGLLWALLGGVTMVIGVGFVILLAAFVWTVYRLVKGFLYWNDRKPLPV